MKYKIALIGCGRISYKHIEAILDNIDQCELAALCDVIEERALERKKQYMDGTSANEPLVYTDYKKMLQEVKPDICAIATESGYHGDIALNCLQADSHVLIEKPMAMNCKEVDEINNLAEKKGLTVGVCHQNRFNPPIQKLKQAIEAGKIGKIVNITGRVLWNRNQAYYDLAPWRGTKALDGGTLMNQCIHNLDVLLWLMNSDVKSIKSERDTFLKNIEMEDYGVVLMRFDNGSIGLLEGSADVYPKNLEETISVFGEKGTVVIGGLAMNEVKTWLIDGEEINTAKTADQVIDNVYGKGHTPLYKDFLDALDMHRLPLIHGKEGRKPVAVLEEVYKI